MEYARAVCVALIAVVFAASTVSKLRDFRGFARSVPALAPVPKALVKPVSIAVVAGEALTVLLVLLPTRAGFVLAEALLLGFTAAIAAAMRRGHRAPCRCFGASDLPIGPLHLARNVVLGCFALLGAATPVHLPPVAGFAVAVVAGVVGAVLVIAMDDIAVVFARSS